FLYRNSNRKLQQGKSMKQSRRNLPKIRAPFHETKQLTASFRLETCKRRKLRKEKKKLPEIQRKHRRPCRYFWSIDRTRRDEDKKLCVENGDDRRGRFLWRVPDRARYFRSTPPLLAVQREIAGITVVQSPYLVVSLP
ncbi:hypothetical protein K0M31_016236, partial [Melipona bicolor]